MKLEHELRKMIKTKVNMQIFLDDFQISYRSAMTVSRQICKKVNENHNQIRNSYEQSRNTGNKVGTQSRNTRNKVGTLGTK